MSGVDKNSGEVSRENSKMTVGTGGGGGVRWHKALLAVEGIGLYSA